MDLDGVPDGYRALNAREAIKVMATVRSSPGGSHKKQGDVMSTRRMTVLVVGATGSIGSPVVEEAIREGHTVRALVRDRGKARRLPPEAQVVVGDVGDVTRPDSLAAAVDGVDAVLLTLGSDRRGKVGAETVDYGGVRNACTRCVRGRPASR